ncbi:hypothetical protein PSTG_03316 [Puccinia striiformis f. sp. tritici PST-78]|uniref:Uncharacterized protein n=1 Tax=Puccinia striiformis f. sp. tritici PST-78 TaxID=1165861 RepID=A0A0L0VWJ9_9BASI|nr:hypothetical protein PSTG_03316 [Puccinia striiformis f. sp. tritici PST-78]
MPAPFFARNRPPQRSSLEDSSSHKMGTLPTFEGFGLEKEASTQALDWCDHSAISFGPLKRVAWPGNSSLRRRRDESLKKIVKATRNVNLTEKPC